MTGFLGATDVSDDMGWYIEQGWGDEDYGDQDDGDEEDYEETSSDLADVWSEALSDEYADADPEAIDDAFAEVMDSMSAAEGINFAKALKQVQRSAGAVVADPIFKQVAGTALPIAGGAVGTLIGGPVGTALGSSLGNAAAGALSGGRPVGRPGGRPGGPPDGRGAPRHAAAIPALAQALPAVAGGSAAAAQGLVLTQQPDVLKSLLALSLGQHGQRSVNGVPVAKIMNMLSSVFGQAAADADELMYLEGAETYTDGDDLGEFTHFTDSAPTGRELYAVLLDSDNLELADALELP